MCRSRESAPRLGRRCHESAPDEVLKRIRLVDGRQARNRLAATRHYDLCAVRDTVEVLAQTIVEITHADLVVCAM
jgi:hypothetical protein